MRILRVLRVSVKESSENEAQFMVAAVMCAKSVTLLHLREGPHIVFPVRILWCFFLFKCKIFYSSVLFFYSFISIM